MLIKNQINAEWSRFGKGFVQNLRVLEQQEYSRIAQTTRAMLRLSNELNDFGIQLQEGSNKSKFENHSPVQYQLLNRVVEFVPLRFFEGSFREDSYERLVQSIDSRLLSGYSNQ